MFRTGPIEEGFPSGAAADRQATPLHELLGSGELPVAPASKPTEIGDTQETGDTKETGKAKKTEVQTGPPKTIQVAKVVAGAIEEEKPGETINENLRKVFYSKMYAQPGTNRWDVQRQLPTLFSQTKTLFFLHEGGDAWTEYGKMALEGVGEAKETARTQLDNAYDEFLSGYLANPLSKRTGLNFRSRLNRLNSLMKKSRKDVSGTPQEAEWLWADATFGDTAGDRGKTNRDTLVKLHATQGSVGYFSDRIQSSIDKQLAYYRNMGEMTEPEILAHMTKTFERKPPSETQESVGQDWATATLA